MQLRMNRWFLLAVLLLSLQSPLFASISCPADSTCITCSGDITTALTNALNGENRVVLSSGTCSFSSQQGWDGDTQIIGAGGLDGSTALTYTGGASPAFSGCASDAAAGFVRGIKLILQNNVGGFCIEGFSNTSMFHDVWIDGGSEGVRLEKSGADQSTSWVGTMADVKFTDQSGHGIVLETGNMQISFWRPRFSGCGDDCMSFENPTNLHSNIQIIGGTFAPNPGSAAIEIQGGGDSTVNTPFVIGDATWTVADSNQDFVQATSSNTVAVSQIDVTPSSCASGNLLLDKPGTADDVACDGANNKLILARHTDGKADVSNLSAGDEAIWQAWWNRSYAKFDIARQSFFDDYSTSNNVACSGDIGSTIQNHWDAGDLVVYVGTGGNSTTGCTTSQVLDPPHGAKLIGRGTGRTGGGAGEGTWINYTGSSSCGILIDDKTGVEISGIKLGATNSGVDVVCWKDMSSDSLMERIDTRNGNSHVVFQPNGSNVAASGGVIIAWLSFNHTAPILRVDGVDSPMDLSVIAPDIGRGSGNLYQINDIDGFNSSFFRAGGVHQIGSSGPTVVNIVDSDPLPIVDLGAMPISISSSENLYVANSDILLTAVGLGSATNPATPTACNFFLNEPGTAEDLNCTLFVRSRVNELTAPPGVTDTTPPTPGNSGTITSSGLTEDSVTLNWTKATDDTSAQSALEYEVCQSGSDDVATVTGCESATVIQAFTADIDTLNVTGLSPATTYFFNVVVRDEAGNKAAYSRIEILTAGAAGYFKSTGFFNATGRFESK